MEEALEGGILAGYPMIDVKVELYDGSYHEVDSSEMAFKIAGSMAIKDGCRKAQPCILEPMMKVEIEIPDEFTGTIIGDISRRRGRAVSYTHLRAHETLRHLVCRLLLEKKK